MQTHVPAPVAQSQKQNQAVQQPAQLLAEPQAAFTDSRISTAQLKNLQGAMSSGPQQQKLQTLQAKINTGTYTQKMQTLQARVTQREGDEEPLQAKFEGETAQREAAAETPKPNNTGLPDSLKSGIESLSGMSMDHVKVHYNSSQPAQLNAHAYAQGSEIHVAPGQEQHLPHEAWHVVQQTQGRVKPTIQMKDGTQVNDNVGLESEADVMGERALSVIPLGHSTVASFVSSGDAQCKQLAPSRVHSVNDAVRYQAGYFDMVSNFTGGAAAGGAAMATPASYNANYIRRNSNGTQMATRNVNVPGTTREYHHGHMLAEAMGGGGGADNVFLQDGGQNTTGAWPSWERAVDNDMKAAPQNHNAEINIELIK